MRATVSKSELFRRLPAVDELLRTAEGAALVIDYGRLNVLEAVRAELDELRAKISNGAVDYREVGRGACTHCPPLWSVVLSGQRRTRFAG